MRDLNEELHCNMLQFEDELEVYMYDGKGLHRPCIVSDLRWLSDTIDSSIQVTG